MTEPVLQLAAVAHTFGRGGRARTALDGVDVRLAPGEALGIVGESGSGKSTLARIACGLLRPGGGRVLLEGEPLRGPDRRIQPLFQDPLQSFDPRWTVGASIGEGLPAAGRKGAGRVADILAAVGLAPDLEHRLPRACSGGQLQRAAVARALAAAPAVLVADEPTAALDPPAAAQICALLLDLRARGLAILYLGHDLGLARQLCGRMAVLYRGRLVESGASAALWERPAHPYTRLLWDAVASGARGPAPEPPAGWPSLESSPAWDGCRFAPRCPHARPACRVEPPLRPLPTPGHAVACHRAEDLAPWRAGAASDSGQFPAGGG